jgi:hypothetical protein
MVRGTLWARLAMLTSRPEPSPHGIDFAANVMHVDTEAICPKCLSWIAPTDVVRRTAYGLVQHEACTATEPIEVDEFSRR